MLNGSGRGSGREQTFLQQGLQQYAAHFAGAQNRDAFAGYTGAHFASIAACVCAKPTS